MTRRNTNKLKFNETNIAWMTFGLTFVMTLFGIPIWVFTTFATQAYVKESNNQIYKNIEERHLDAIAHSDLNRASVENELRDQTGTLTEIRDTLRTLEERIWLEQNPRPYAKLRRKK
jgi:hypothetical protein